MEVIGSSDKALGWKRNRQLEGWPDLRVSGEPQSFPYECRQPDLSEFFYAKRGDG